MKDIREFYRMPRTELESTEARQVADLLGALKVSWKDWDTLTEVFFDELAERAGQYEARRIFNKHARPITKREAQIEGSARLLLRYITMKPKRNLSKLAREMAAEEDVDEAAIAQRLWRALNRKTAYGKKVREYLREDLLERGITVQTFDPKTKTAWRYWPRSVAPHPC